MKFLIDECLTIDLVSVAREAGYEAYHAAHIGKAGWKDWNVARHAGEGDFVVVTNNAHDFLKLYAEYPLHAGLVILVPSIRREAQARLFRAVIDRLVAIGEPINQVLEVGFEGENVNFTIYNLSAKRS
jgi:predicted nuclease of predicted toxin-antitoxin system